VRPKKVRRLMRVDNLMAVRRRRFVVPTESDHRFGVHPNLAENLEITDINQLWIADLTYLRSEQEFAYLAVVMDAYSRRVIRWALGRSLEVRLTLEALEQAIAARQPKPGAGSPFRPRDPIRLAKLRGSTGATANNNAGRALGEHPHSSWPRWPA
jgi:transposase InsO family protein